MMFTELRVRTVCELVLNEKYYLQPHIVSLLDPFGVVVSKNALPTTLSASVCHVPTVDTDFATSMLHSECIQTAKNGNYSCMWHIHAMATVLRRPIVSIYPERNLRIRPMFHRECPPRIPYNKTHGNALIMWTRITDSGMEAQEWSPNHFVTVVPYKHTVQTPVSVTQSEEPSVGSPMVSLTSSQQPTSFSHSVELTMTVSPSYKPGLSSGASPPQKQVSVTPSGVPTMCTSPLTPTQPPLDSTWSVDHTHYITGTPSHKPGLSFGTVSVSQPQKQVPLSHSGVPTMSTTSLTSPLSGSCDVDHTCNSTALGTPSHKSGLSCGTVSVSQPQKEVSLSHSGVSTMITTTLTSPLSGSCDVDHTCNSTASGTLSHKPGLTVSASPPKKQVSVTHNGVPTVSTHPLSLLKYYGTIEASRKKKRNVPHVHTTIPDMLAMRKGQDSKSQVDLSVI